MPDGSGDSVSRMAQLNAQAQLPYLKRAMMTPAQRVSNAFNVRDEGNNPAMQAQNPDYYKYDIMLDPTISGGAQNAEANLSFLRSMPPKEQLKWFMKMTGEPPVKKDFEDFGEKDFNAMAKYHTDNIEKIIKALRTGEGLPQVPMSK